MLGFVYTVKEKPYISWYLNIAYLVWIVLFLLKIIPLQFYIVMIVLTWGYVVVQNRVWKNRAGKYTMEMCPEIVVVFGKDAYEALKNYEEKNDV